MNSTYKKVTRKAKICIWTMENNCNYKTQLKEKQKFN